MFIKLENWLYLKGVICYPQNFRLDLDNQQNSSSHNMICKYNLMMVQVLAMKTTYTNNFDHGVRRTNYLIYKSYLSSLYIV